MSGTRPITRQRGFIAIEMLFGLIALAMIASTGLNLMARHMDSLNYQIAADQQQQVAEAAAQYLKDNFAAVYAAAGPTAPVTITPAMLRNTHYLPASFADTNAFGQTFTVLARRVATNQLESVVLTTGGETLDEIGTREIAENLGAPGGFIPTSDPGIVQGVRGGWQLALSNYGMNPGVGHTASALFLQDGTLANDYLYRNAIPGRPELNRMNTTLDMGGQDIVNAASITASEDVSAGQWFRSLGNGGWYSEQWGGGWYMSDSDWVRVYGNKGVYTGGQVRGGSLASEGRTTVGEYLQLDGVATEGSSCPRTGLFARDVNGLPLSCQGGKWTGNVGIGYGQTWQLVSRALNSTYVNDTAKPIMVVPTILCNGYGNSWKRVFIHIDNVEVGQFSVYDTDGGDQNVDLHPATFIVPPGQSYAVTSVDTGFCSIIQWAELR